MALIAVSHATDKHNLGYGIGRPGSYPTIQRSLYCPVTVGPTGCQLLV